MKNMNVTEKMKVILEPKKAGIKARLFVTREDGITIYDSVQNQTTTSVSALVSGVWQASEALMDLVHPNQDVMEFRLGFDTSSQGIYLFPFSLLGKRYFLGAIYHDCVNPGQLKRQIALIKEEMVRLFQDEAAKPVAVKPKTAVRDGFLFQDISDEEIDRLFSAGI
ncbi:hypothetical protein [Peredibacter starrii]|uniref:Uncharacterized protein n=1 Tax=Peredibacter starrii TaxID=28202 RepID=A0AAX4HQJ3_9BACT|nr:hypothetical protein [Peredibacter starrii]WPU65465.1 hypothetical protein SOO65_01770 [Peredibacter starrii]